MLEFPVLCDQMPYTIVGLPYAAEAATTGTNLDSLVGALVGQMLELQPEGPFRIMGHSFGALLSLQVARHLENESHVVQSLVLVDPPRLNTAPQGLHLVPVNKSVERLLRLFPHGLELPISLQKSTMLSRASPLCSLRRMSASCPDVLRSFEPQHSCCTPQTHSGAQSLSDRCFQLTRYLPNGGVSTPSNSCC